MKKINITDKIGTAIAYKGCVTIEYFDKIDGKKVINAYNEGQTALFNAIVKMLSGRDINNIARPKQIDLFTLVPSTDPSAPKESSVLSRPVAYLVTPVLYIAEKHIDDKGNITYTYSNGDNVETDANCIMYSFTIALGNYNSEVDGKEVTTLKLLGDNNNENKVFAILDLESINSTIKIDTSSNMQIYWRLIFE